jgi:putative transposase
VALPVSTTTPPAGRIRRNAARRVIERFMRTLKEQCLWLHRFTDLAHAEREIGAFIERYNGEWLVERHGHCTPREVRAKMRAAA